MALTSLVLQGCRLVSASRQIAYRFDFQAKGVSELSPKLRSLSSPSTITAVNYYKFKLFALLGVLVATADGLQFMHALRRMSIKEFGKTDKFAQKLLLLRELDRFYWR